MSDISDTGKKIVAGALAGTIAVTGGVIANQKRNNDNPEYLVPSQSINQEYYNPLSNTSEYNINGKIYTVSETNGIFANVTEKLDATIEPTTKTTESLESKLDKRIIKPSRFYVKDNREQSLDNLYQYYETIWQNENNGKTAMDFIKEAHLIENDELKVAVALAFLKDRNINPLELLHQLKVIQVSCLYGSEGIDSEIVNDLKPLLDLFPEEFLASYGSIFNINKIFLPLANEFTALKDVAENNIIAITFNVSSLTPELVALANSYGIKIDNRVVMYIEKKNNIEITLSDYPRVRK